MPFNPFQAGQQQGNAMAYGPPQGVLGNILNAANMGLNAYAAGEQEGAAGLASMGTGVLSAFADKKKQEWEDGRKRQLEQEKFLTDSVHDIVKKYQGQDLSEYPELTQMMDKYRQTLASDSPGGNLITPKEAMEIIAWDTRVGKEAQLLGQQKAQRDAMVPFQARDAFAQSLQPRIDEGDESARMARDTIYPKPMIQINPQTGRPVGEYVPPSVANKMMGDQNRAGEKALDRTLARDIEQLRHADRMAAQMAATGRADEKLEMANKLNRERLFSRFVADKSQYSFGRAQDPNALRAEFESLFPQEEEAMPPQGNPMQQGPPPAPALAPQGPPPSPPSPTGAKPMAIGSLPPRMQQAVLSAPDGQSFTLKGVEYVKQGNALVPRQ